MTIARAKVVTGLEKRQMLSHHSHDSRQEQHPNGGQDSRTVMCTPFSSDLLLAWGLDGMAGWEGSGLWQSRLLDPFITSTDSVASGRLSNL